MRLGPNAIAVGGTTEGEAFLAFQKFVKRLKQSGVLLAACSKNNDADAREPFEKNDQMALRLDDFAAFHASWDAKPSRIRAIAAELNLGLDSFVFFDDNPAERAHVRAELPEVMVVEVPRRASALRPRAPGVAGIRGRRSHRCRCRARDAVHRRGIAQTDAGRRRITRKRISHRSE